MKHWTVDICGHMYHSDDDAEYEYTEAQVVVARLNHLESLCELYKTELEDLNQYHAETVKLVDSLLVETRGSKQIVDRVLLGSNVIRGPWGGIKS